MMFDNWKEEQERIHNDYDAENAWYAGQQSQQAKIDELQKLRSLDEMAINQLAQANQVWQIKCDELQARVDEALGKCRTGIRKQGGDYYLELVEDILKGNKDGRV